MKSQKGIALIASLLIMTVIMTVGIGSIGLSIMNSRIAENTRSAAIAEANAETSINAAIIALNTYYKTSTNKKFPQSTSSKFSSGFSIPTINGVAAFAANDYIYITNADQTGYTLTMKGRTVSGGLHQSEVLVGSSTSGVGSSSFPPGFVSEGVVRVSGNPQIVNAGVHGNRGYILSGNPSFQTCSASGSCTTLTGTNQPVTAQEQPAPPETQVTYTCSATSSSTAVLCSGGTPAKKAPKMTVGPPPYATMRTNHFGLSNTMTLNSPSSSSFPSGCTTTSMLAASYPAGSKICVTPSNGQITVPSNANYSGVTIIVKGNVEIKDAAKLTNTNLLSMGTLTIKKAATLMDSRLLADSSVVVSEEFSYNGSTTIASGGTLELKGNGVYTGSTASTDVGLAFMSVGNMTVDGNVQSSGPLRAALWSGRNVALNGNAKIRGGVYSVGSTDVGDVDLDIPGNTYLDGGATFVNTDLPSAAASSPAILSRR